MDAYIQKVISRLGLSEAQQGLYAEELRNRLEANLRAFLDQGIPLDEAYCRTIEDMGPIWPPKVSCWHWIGIITIWAIVYGLLTVWVRYFYWPTLESGLNWMFLGLLAFSCFQTSLIYFEHRVYKKRISLLWKILEDSSLSPRGSLINLSAFGSPFFGYRIQSGKKRWTVTATKTFSLALLILGGHAFDEKAKSLLESRMAFKPERRVNKLIVTAAALLAALLSLREYALYPDGDCVSLGFAAALVLFGGCAIFMAFTSFNRTKVFLFELVGGLVGGLFVFTYFPGPVSLIAGVTTFTGFRYLIIFFVVLTGIFINLVWWNSYHRKLGAVITVLAVTASATICGYYYTALPPRWQRAFKIAGITNSIQWLHNNPSAIVTTSDRQGNSLLHYTTITDAGDFLESRVLPLVGGNWTYVPQFHKSSPVYYLRNYNEKNDGTGLSSTVIYRFRSDCSLSQITTSHNTIGSQSIFVGGSIVSPDQSCILLSGYEPGNVVVHSLVDGTSQSLSGVRLINFWRWSDDHQAEFLEDGPSTSQTIRLTTVDTQDLTTTRGRVISLYENYKLTIIKSDEAVILTPNTPYEEFTPSTMFHDHREMMWLNPDEETSYPLTSTSDGPLRWDWNSDKTLLAYKSNASGTKALYVADKNGVQDTSNLQEGYESGWLSLSPDGRKIIYLDRAVECRFSDTGRLRLWDRNTGKTTTLALVPGVNSVFGYFQYDAPDCKLVQWLSDSSGFLWAHFVYNRDPALHDKFFPAVDTQFYRYQFEK